MKETYPFMKVKKSSIPNPIFPMNQTLLRKVFSLGISLRQMLLSIAWILIVCSSHAQPTVSGRVLSVQDNEPLPGVNILVKGTTDGTISDAEGNFSIAVPSIDVVLVFSFVGYHAQEVIVGGRSSIQVLLATDAQQLSEVVVTAL